MEICDSDQLVTLKVKRNAKTAALEFTGDSVLGVNDLENIIDALASAPAHSGLAFALVDLSGAKRIANVDHVVEFSTELRSTGLNCALKVAFVLGPATLPLAQIVLALQVSGVWTTDFETRADAEAWLFDDSAKAPAWIIRQRR